MYDTNNVGGDQKLENCYLEVGYGKKYPETEYTPQTEPTRVFRDVLKYVHVVNEYDYNTLLNRHNFAALFPFIYFDLTKQPTDIRNGLTKLVFKYSLTAWCCWYVLRTLFMHLYFVNKTLKPKRWVKN